MNIFGHNFRLAIWGESHGPQIGISIDGVPAGIPLSAEDFEADLARRRSGARGTTPRREPDIPQIVSGLYNGMTTGRRSPSNSPTPTPIRRTTPP